MSKTTHVLFLCTGNSARSILAEALLNYRGGPRFHAYSAGSHPTGKVHPGALQQLISQGISTEGLRSKSWDEFTRAGAPQIDWLITVCDNAAHEICPLWTAPVTTVHWGLPDPAAVTDSPEHSKQAFAEVFAKLDQLMTRLLALDALELSPEELKRELEKIGQE